MLSSTQLCVLENFVLQNQQKLMPTKINETTVCNECDHIINRYSGHGKNWRDLTLT